MAVCHVSYTVSLTQKQMQERWEGGDNSVCLLLRPVITQYRSESVIIHHWFYGETNNQPPNVTVFTIFFFLLWGRPQNLFWVGQMKKNQTIIPEAFPILDSICGKGGRNEGGTGEGCEGGFSHFRLRDLGHTLTVWLTSGWWVRKPGVDLEPHFSCDWPWPSDLLLWPVFISPFTGKRLDESEVCPDFYTCAWVLIHGHVAAEVHTCM